MSVRTRTFLACLFAAVLPLALLAVGARREVRDRLSAGFEARVAASGLVLQQDLAAHAATLDARLDAIGAGLAADPERRAALMQQESRAALIDLAPSLMVTAGLDYLVIMDAAGLVLSAGHFRSDYGRSMRHANALLAANQAVLTTARRPQGIFLALVRARRFTLGGRSYTVAAGIEVDSAFVRGLVRGADDELFLALDFPGGTLLSHAQVADVSGRGALAAQIALPFIDDAQDPTAGSMADARWTITHSLAPLHDVQRAMDRWFLAAVAAAVLLAFVIARIIAARVSKPIEELARRTTRVHLDRVDVSFATRRSDEIGTLSRMLDAMVQRLRAGAAQLRDAERRATVGDMARQVNHDIRNGLLPIRNVVRHLAEVAADEPAELGAVFAERQSTLTGGITYLESLATNYARLSPAGVDQVCDVNEIARNVAHDAVTTANVRLSTELTREPLRVSADPVALRRVVENLVINAVESITGGDGSVTLTTRAQQDRDRRVIITVADTGAGIGPGDLDRVFADFFTTKEHGTGLGLSIVRRLVADMGGRISIDSRPGAGTAFHVELPGLP